MAALTDQILPLSIPRGVHGDRVRAVAGKSRAAVVHEGVKVVRSPEARAARDVEVESAGDEIAPGVGAQLTDIGVAPVSRNAARAADIRKIDGHVRIAVGRTLFVPESEGMINLVHDDDLRAPTRDVDDLRSALPPYRRVIEAARLKTYPIRLRSPDGSRSLQVWQSACNSDPPGPVKLPAISACNQGPR